MSVHESDFEAPSNDENRPQDQPQDHSQDPLDLILGQQRRRLVSYDDDDEAETPAPAESSPPALTSELTFFVIFGKIWSHFPYQSHQIRIWSLHLV